MPTLGDLAKRLYDKFAATQELLEPKQLRFMPTRWEELPEWRQEVWVTIAAEAVKVGVEVQKELDESRWAKIEQQWDDLRVSLEQMARGEGRVLHDCE
jgi:hypothetical protein